VSECPVPFGKRTSSIYTARTFSSHDVNNPVRDHMNDHQNPVRDQMNDYQNPVRDHMNDYQNPVRDRMNDHHNTLTGISHGSGGGVES